MPQHSVRTGRRRGGAGVAALALVVWPLLAPGPLAARDTAAPQRAAGALARGAAVYRYAPASSDGIGKFYHGREIARVMGFAGAPWLERPDREQQERPDWLLEELRLEGGMTIADVGAGSGYLTRRLTRLVPRGKVYAIDVQPEMVAMLHDLAMQPGLGNIVPQLGAADDVGLPPESVDLALLVDVYHELEFPREVISSLVRALRPGGRLVFVEYRAEDPRVPIKALHKMSVAQLRRELRPFPLVWERSSERLPVQHIVIFRRRE